MACLNPSTFDGIEPCAESGRRQIVERARRFAQGIVRQHASASDAGQFPRAVLEAAGDLGLLGILVPTRYDGSGLDHIALVLCIEEVAAECGSSSVTFEVHNSVAVEPLLLFGSDKQKAQWLPRLARGEILGAFALTEADAGSDVLAQTTIARFTGGRWILTGRKMFVSSVGEAGLYTVVARTASGRSGSSLSAFLVPGTASGLVVGRVFGKLGLNGSPTGELILDRVALPPESLLGSEGTGFAIAMRVLAAGRIGVAAQAVGLARGAFQRALGFVREFGCSGLPLSGQEGVQFMLADMATQIDAARLLAHRAADLCDRGADFTGAAAMAKLFASEMAMRVTSQCVDLCGFGAGSVGHQVERCFRDAKALEIYEGTNQIQKLIITRDLIRNANRAVSFGGAGGHPAGSPNPREALS